MFCFCFFWQTCLSHCCRALPAAVQVNFDKRDGLVVVLVTLLVDDKQVLPLHGSIPV